MKLAVIIAHLMVNVCCVLNGRGAVADELACLTDAEKSTGRLYTQLQYQAFAALDRRLEVYEELETPEQIRAYQHKHREFLVRQLGGFPERTPLAAHTVRTIQADGYRIELVIFESQPSHHVTANLYLPTATSPVPAIVVASGHSRTGKIADYNQRLGIMMARHGMAALCYDPIGQGERSQILDPEGQPLFNGTTTEHFLMGVGSILVGRNTARYRVWDAMRAIDYLAQRPEVDPKRIGFTGCSGGGTLTSYLMALDERVACAAPACYLTTLRRLIETIGPQDAEQNVFGQVRFGLDQPDYVLMRAPRPTLICATTDDFFDIHGTWDNFRQAKRIYAKLGFPERVDLIEVEGDHGIKPQSLATIAQWMKRWLMGIDEPVAVETLATRQASELRCTQSGQVLTSLPGERSVFDLNAKYAADFSQQRKEGWSTATPDQRRAMIRKLLAIGSDVDSKPPTWQDRGRVGRDSYHVDKLVLETGTGVPLPALTFHPPSPRDEAYLYLHDGGKLGDSDENGPIEKLVDQGYAVVTVDLRGQGETGMRERDDLLTDWKTYYLAYLLGRPLVGMRVEDTLAAAAFVAYYERPRNNPRKVHLVAVGQTGIVALHAASLKPELFASVTLHDTPRSWLSVVGDPTPRGQLDSTVHGALKVYDLPDLVQLAGADKVQFEAKESAPR